MYLFAFPKDYQKNLHTCHSRVELKTKLYSTSTYNMSNLKVINAGKVTHYYAIFSELHSYLHLPNISTSKFLEKCRWEHNLEKDP